GRGLGLESEGIRLKESQTLRHGRFPGVVGPSRGRHSSSINWPLISFTSRSFAQPHITGRDLHPPPPPPTLATSRRAAPHVDSVLSRSQNSYGIFSKVYRNCCRIHK